MYVSLEDYVFVIFFTIFSIPKEVFVFLSVYNLRCSDDSNIKRTLCGSE